PRAPPPPDGVAPVRHEPARPDDLRLRRAGSRRDHGAGELRAGTRRDPGRSGADVARRLASLGPSPERRRSNQALGLSIPCMVSQLTKALNQPVLVVSLGYMPKP